MTDRSRAEFDWPRACEWLACVVVASVSVIHVVHFFGRDGLRFDEARVALNLVERSFAGLVRPLDYEQAAPIGFLWIEKAMVALFGRSEYALRLVPLLAALAAPLVLWSAARRIAGRSAGALAAILLAAHPTFVLYAAEVKQYSLDVLVAAVLIALARPVVMGEPVGPARLRWLGVASVLAVLLSHPATLVVGTMWPVLLIAGRPRRPLLAGAIASFATIGVVYWISLAPVTELKWALDFWKDAFAPWPPWTHLGWYRQAIDDWLSTRWTDDLAHWIPRLSFALGVVALWRRRPAPGALLVALLIAPAAAALAASLAGRYPFADRLLLFAVPGAAVVMATGIASTFVRAAAARRGRALLLGASALLVLGWVPSLRFAATKLVAGHNNKIDSRPLLAVMMGDAVRDAARGDVVLADSSMNAVVRVYAPTYPGGDQLLAAGARPWAQDLAGLAALLSQLAPGQAAWLLTVDRRWPDWADPRPPIERVIGQAGLRFTRTDANGATLYRIR